MLSALGLANGLAVAWIWLTERHDSVQTIP